MIAQSDLPKDIIIRDYGEVGVNNDQKVRVLVVKDGYGMVRVSIQTWWQESGNEEWIMGRGFRLRGRHSMALGRIIASGIKSTQEGRVGGLSISNTQEIRVEATYVSGALVLEIYKWWRVNTDSQWTKSKGFTLELSKSPLLGKMLIEGGSHIVHVQD